MADYLFQFAKLAKEERLDFGYRNNIMQTLSSQLFQDAQDLCESLQPIVRWKSIVDDSAQKSTMNIAKEVDRLNKRRSEQNN